MIPSANSLRNRSQSLALLDLAGLLLYLALFLRAIGLARKFLWSPFETETSVFGFLYFDAGTQESLALSIDNGLIWTYLVLAIVLLGTVCLSSPRIARTITARCTVFPVGRGEGAGRRKTFATVRAILNGLRIAALRYCLLWELLLVLAIIYRDDAFRPFLTPATHALRIATPLLLLGFCQARRESRRSMAGVAQPSATDASSIVSISARWNGTRWLACGLRFAIALTFLGHGWSAWSQHPEYATYVIATASNLWGWELDQSSVETGLGAVAIVDVAVAVGLILISPSTKRHRWLLGYAAVWGLITAASRITTSGVFVGHETLLRASHFLGPLALICVCSQGSDPIVATWSQSDRIEN